MYIYANFQIPNCMKIIPLPMILYYSCDNIYYSFMLHNIVYLNIAIKWLFV